MKSDVQVLIITATAVLCHIYRIYPIGARGDEWLDCYQANFTSVCFVIGVSLLLSLNNLWPAALKAPPQFLLCLYLSLVSAFTVSLALRMVWLPLTLSITQVNLYVAYKLKTCKSIKGVFVSRLTDLLESQILQNVEIALLAVLFLGYALKASGIYKGSNPYEMHGKHGHLKADVLKRSRRAFGKNFCTTYLPDAIEDEIQEEDIIRDGTNFFSELVYNGGFREVVNNYISSYL